MALSREELRKNLGQLKESAKKDEETQRKVLEVLREKAVRHEAVMFEYLIDSQLPLVYDGVVAKIPVEDLPSREARKELRRLYEPQGWRLEFNSNHWDTELMIILY